MVTGWNYDGILKIKEKILEEKYDNYNVVDLLTGDTRAMSTRYLLTVNNNPPMAVEDYPGAEYLFVYSKDPIEQILKGNLWEIDSIRPVTVIKTWEVQNGINLYLLKKAQISAVLE